MEARCGDVIRVGIHDKPPFAAKTDNGDWARNRVGTLEGSRSPDRVELPSLLKPRMRTSFPPVAEGRLRAAVGEMGITAEARKNRQLHAAVC